MPLLDDDEVLLMDTPLNPLLVRFVSTFKCKRRRTDMACGIRVDADLDGEDPLSGARVELDIETVQKKIGSVYVDFSPFPPNFLPTLPSR